MILEPSLGFNYHLLMFLGEYGGFSSQRKAILSVPDTTSHPPDGGLKVSDDPPKSIIRLQGAIEVRGKCIESTSGVENHFERMQCVLTSVIKLSVRDLHGQETQR